MIFNLKTVSELTSFLVSKKITPNQALFCHLLYFQDMANFYRYVHEFKQFTAEEVGDLEDRGYIINQDYHSKTRSSDMYVVTELLLDGLDLIGEELGVEFWNAYPSFINVNGTKVPAKSTDRDALIRDYTRKSITTQQAHKRIMSILDYAKQRDMITMGIRKWIDSQQWEAVEQVMKADNNQILPSDVEFQ